MSLLFSQRNRMARDAELWLVERQLPISGFNFVTALDALGYLKDKREEQSIKEGIQSKGGVNSRPVSPPPLPPKGQGGNTCS